MNSSIILRDPAAPPIHVLELDGPRQKYVQRGEGAYYLETSNLPVLISPLSLGEPATDDPRLTDWESPHWEIYQMHDGGIEIHACRPTESEIHEGDLHGALGSVIKVSWPCRPILRNALRLARRLMKADPMVGISVTRRHLVGIVVIETDIPVHLNRH